MQDVRPEAEQDAIRSVLPCEPPSYLLRLPSPRPHAPPPHAGPAHLPVNLGSSGLKVSRLILGCMSYGDPSYESWMLDEATGIDHIKYAYESGINTFDTANTYAGGKSEVILGKALKAIGVSASPLSQPTDPSEAPLVRYSEVVSGAKETPS